jgi:hypothetical protein
MKAISGWLNGKTMPKQDKLRVLAAIVGLAPHELQFGEGKPRIGEVKAHWAEAMGPQDLAMIDGYASLPAVQRKLVRDLVAALAVASKND